MSTKWWLDLASELISRGYLIHSRHSGEMSRRVDRKDRSNQGIQAVDARLEKMPQVIDHRKSNPEAPGLHKLAAPGSFMRRLRHMKVCAG